MKIKKITAILLVGVFVFLGYIFFQQKTNQVEDKVRALPEVQEFISRVDRHYIYAEDRGDDFWHIQVAEVISDGEIDGKEMTHTNTFNWYKVDNKGNIVCSMFTYEDGKLLDVPANDCN